MKVGLCIVAGLLLVGCSSSGGTTDDPAAVKQWMPGHALQIRQMRGAAANVQLTLREPGASEYCTQLAAAIPSVISGLPTPDKTLTADLRSAVDGYSKAAYACVNGAPTAAWQHLTSGEIAMQKAVNRSEKIGAPIY